MFDIYKRFSLAKYGDTWKNCYLNFSPISINELETEIAEMASVDTKDAKAVNKATRKTIELLGNHFVDGVAIKDGKEVPVKKEDLGKLPAELLQEVIGFLSQSSLPIKSVVLKESLTPKEK